MFDVRFHASQGDDAAGVMLYFISSKLFFEIYKCAQYFETGLTGADDKIWRITKTTTSHVRLQIHCNDVEVLNILMSETTCEDYGSDWSKYWSKDIDKIYFTSSYIAPVHYRPYPGKK